MIIVGRTPANAPVIILDQAWLTDASALEELHDVILSEVAHGEKENVVLDFELVEMIDSLGLSMLLQIKSKLKKKGAMLHLCGLGANVAKVIEDTNLQKLFPVHENVEAAQRAILSGGASWLSPGLRHGLPTPPTV